MLTFIKGSGKTYTIEGGQDETKGIIPRATELVFQCIPYCTRYMYTNNAEISLLSYITGLVYVRCIRGYTYFHKHTQWHTHTDTHAHSHTHSGTHAQWYTHTHMHTRTLTRTHTHTQLSQFATHIYMDYHLHFTVKVHTTCTSHAKRK